MDKKDRLPVPPPRALFKVAANDTSCDEKTPARKIPCLHTKADGRAQTETPARQDEFPDDVPIDPGTKVRTGVIGEPKLRRPPDSAAPSSPILKRRVGRPKSIDDPWVKAGVPKSTYYRRQKKDAGK